MGPVLTNQTSRAGFHSPSASTQSRLGTFPIRLRLWGRSKTISLPTFLVPSPEEPGFVFLPRRDDGEGGFAEERGGDGWGRFSPTKLPARALTPHPPRPKAVSASSPFDFVSGEGPRLAVVGGHQETAGYGGETQ
jgi:hypothetical protein